MRPPLFVRPLTAPEETSLREGLRSADGFTLRRCQMLLASGRGQTVAQITTALGYPPQSVRDVIRAFNREGLAATLTRRSNRPRSGRTSGPVLDEARRERLRELLARGPRAFKKDAPVWTLALVAQVAHEQGLTPTRLSAETVRVALSRLGLSWRRAKSWIVSDDPAYARKKSAATG